MARLPGDILRDIHLGLGALSPADKAKVAEVLVDDLSGMGRVNDTDLAHITPAEAMMLRQAGGAGTLNPETGLPEYWAMGFGPAAVASATSGASGASSGPGPMGITAQGVAQGLAALGLGTGPSAPGSTGTGSAVSNAPTRGNTTTTTTAEAPPGQMLGITPAEVSSIVSNMKGQIGDAGTAEGFVFADTRGDTPADSPADSNVIVDKNLFKFDKKQQLDKLESHYNWDIFKDKMNQQLDRMQLDKTNFDLSKNIDNPFLPKDLAKLDWDKDRDREVITEDRTVIRDRDGKPILTRDGNVIDVPNLTVENMINRYVTEAAEKNRTMYGLEKYNEPYKTISEQLGFDRSSWLSRTEKAAKDSWVSRQTSDLGSWISNNLGKVSDFVGDAPFMAFLSRSPLSVIQSFISEMLSKQTPALRDKTRMYLAAQSYAQRGLKIPEMSELAAHDFSGKTGQPYLGEETFTDQWKTVPTLEKVEQIREEDRLEQERRLKGLEEAYRAEQLAELSKYFDTVSDEYLSLRDQPTYNPIGIEQLLGNT
tara:strand:+ start:1850 stop:3460 length:1611 start_codon:yes stop_codon:yes gene_type:complete